MLNSLFDECLMHSKQQVDDTIGMINRRDERIFIESSVLQLFAVKRICFPSADLGRSINGVHRQHGQLQCDDGVTSGIIGGKRIVIRAGYIQRLASE